jgi:transcriptional regulator with XRE-family HTH domain
MTLTLLRKKKGYSAEEMAKRLEISRGHYSHLELGTRDFTEELLKKTASILDCDPERVRDLSQRAKEQNYSPESWVLRIHIDDKPFLTAFRKYLDTANQKQLRNEDLVSVIGRFLAYRIEHSAINELRKNPTLLNYIERKLSLDGNYNH